MGKRILSVLIILVTIISISNTSFAMAVDIKSHWAKKDINYLLEHKILYNYSDGTFRPNQNITRAELMNAINNLFGYKDIEVMGFIDTDKASWYCDDIGRAVSVGYIEGYNDAIMKANEPITREEASKLIAIACGLENQLPKSIYAFSDAHSISKETIIYVNLLNEKGYMSGFQDGTFKPKRKISRGEASAILAKIKKDLDPLNEDNIPVEKVPKGKARIYSVQTGVYGSLNSATKQKEALINSGFKNALIVKDEKTSNYHVMADYQLNEDQAYILKFRIVAKGYEGYITSELVNESNIVSKDKVIENSKDTVNKGKDKKGNYYVQTGIYSTIEASLKQRDSLEASGFSNAFIINNPGNSNYCVMADGYLSKREANLLKTKLIEKKFEAYVTLK